MAKLAFCDYHNMVAILEKTEHNTDFHQIVDFLKASHIRRHLKLNDEAWISSLPDAELFENLSLMGYNILPNQSNIATAMVCLATNMVYNFSKMIFDGMVRNINNVGQDKENIPKTSTLPHESSPRVTSLDADKGSMQQRIHKLMELCTSLQRQQSQMAAKIKDQDLEISGLKAKVKSLEDKNRRSTEPTQEDAPITREIIEIGEELGADKSTKLGSNDTKEMVNVLSSIDAVNILTSRGAAASVSSAKVLPAAGVPTVSGSFPTISAIFTTASVIDAQVAKEMEEEFARESQRLSEQLARDSEIARLHAEEELKMMIEGLDRNNEVIAKHLQEYEQAETDLSVGQKLELIILRSHAGWKTKHFRGMTLEQIKEKFTPVWKQFEDFVPMNSKEESERLVPLEEVYTEALQVKHPIIDWETHFEGKREYWKIIRLGGHTTVYQFFVDMLKQFNKEDLHQLWTLVKETFSIRQATKDKEKELWVELKILFEPDFEDQLWTHNQAFMHDPLDWKLYDTCGVHHVSTKDQEIFMLVERDYPLRRGLANVMISNKLQVEQYSQMANDLILKIHNIANSPR
nr:hypothetical protein [Tanacetum cinerariifolium]